jgi:hypothetical protein
MTMKARKPELISNSTILILSGFLIGLTVGKIVNESLSPYVLSCGLSGFLAFIALEFTGTQREEQAAHEEQVQVQSRLDRHVMSLSSISFTLPPPSPDSTKSSADQKALDSLYEQLTKSEPSSTILEATLQQRSDA